MQWLCHFVHNYFYVLGQNDTFVDVNYDADTRRVICAFRDMEDESKKSCTITYSICGHEDVRIVHGNSTGYQIILELDDLQDVFYCYVATISNSTFTVNIDGRIEQGNHEKQ